MCNVYTVGSWVTQFRAGTIRVVVYIIILLGVDN